MTGTSAPELPEASGAARSIGILGGTFNPPHLGHVAIARAARAQLGCERVVLVPVHTPPHKPGGADPGAEHRLRMCQLAARGVEGLEVCAVEVERGGPSYTVDTLNEIHASHPEAGLTFIVGADTARTLASWREPTRVLELADLAVAARSGSAQADVLDTVAGAADGGPAGRPAAARVTFLEMPTVDVSSSQVRSRVARGEPIAHLVGVDVARYIRDNGLYRDDGDDGAS